MIGNRIKQARKASGLSLRALGEKANVSAMAISKYENNQSMPSSGVLLKLGDVLGVPMEYFLRFREVELKEVEYRKHAKLPKKVLQQVEGDVVDQVERYAELEDILPVSPIMKYALPYDLPAEIGTEADIEEAADRLRAAWGLGKDPIFDLTGALEERGIKIFQTSAAHENKFDGLACEVNGSPIIVVGRDWPGDRQRFIIAHELGHRVLPGRLTGDLQNNEEKAANRFACAFLVPRSEVLKELGPQRTWLEPKELFLLKKAYGLSMGGWLHRAHDLSIIATSTCKKMNSMFRQRGWHKEEPWEQYPRERPQVFEQLIYHALAEDLISESKAAELMRMSLVDFRATRNVTNDSSVTS